MKLIFASFLLICWCLEVHNEVQLFLMDQFSIDDAWYNFKTTQKLNFKNSIIESKRKNIFQENLKIINEHNRKYINGETTYTLGINRFADWTIEEIREFMNRQIKNISLSTESDHTHQVKGITIPSSVDWRVKYNIPIRDQLYCGSCWAFSALYEIEFFNLKLNRKLIDLSEQVLVDCVYKRDGCTGGWMKNAFDYIIKMKGIRTESDYPYTSIQEWSGSCNSDEINLGPQLSSYNYIKSGSEKDLVDAIANVGPVSVGIYASDSFAFYKSGVFVDDNCQYYPNHAVNLVGYGTEKNQDYYILRNSWGENWGNNGYMYFARNKKNMCNVATYGIYPNVKRS